LTTLEVETVSENKESLVMQQIDLADQVVPAPDDIDDSEKTAEIDAGEVPQPELEHPTTTPPNPPVPKSHANTGETVSPSDL